MATDAPASSPRQRVFVSYAREDAAAMERIVGALTTHGLECAGDWQVPRGVPSFRRALEAQIRSADVVLALLSESAIASRACRAEWRLTAISKKRLVAAQIASRLDEASLDRTVRSTQWAYLFEPATFEKEIGKLVDGIATDFTLLRDHAWFLGRAHEWSGGGALLAGADLLRARKIADQLAHNQLPSPRATVQQRKLLEASERWHTRTQRLRRTMGAGAVVAILAAAAAAFLFRARAGTIADDMDGRDLAEEALLPGRARDVLTRAAEKVRDGLRRERLSNQAQRALSLAVASARVLEPITSVDTVTAGSRRSSGWSPPPSSPAQARATEALTKGGWTLLAVSRDGALGAGRRLPGQNVTVLAAPDGSPVRELPDTNGVQSAEFATRSHRLLTLGGWDERGVERVRVWEAVTAQSLFDSTSLRWPRPVVALLAPWGDRIAYLAQKYDVHVSDLETGTLVGFNTYADALSSGAFSSDGRYLVVGSAGRIRVFDTRTGDTLLVDASPWSGAAKLLSISDDGTSVLTSAERVAYLWRTADGTQLASLAGPSPVIAGEVRPGERVHLQRERSLEEWATAPDASIACGRARSGHDMIAYSSDGSAILSARRLGDGDAGVSSATARHPPPPTWYPIRMGNGLCENLPPPSNPAKGVPLPPPPTPIRTQRLVDASERRGGLTPQVVVPSPDGKRVAAANFMPTEHRDEARPGQTWMFVVPGHGLDLPVQIWDASDGSVIFELVGAGATVRDVAFSPDGSNLVTLDAGGNVRIFPASMNAMLKRAQALLDSASRTAAKP